jgi:putative transposase
VSQGNLVFRRRIDELHLEYPFAGSRMLRELLRGEGVAIGWAHVITLTKRIGARPSAGGRPHSSLGAPAHGESVTRNRGFVVRAPRLGAGLLPL